MLSSQDYQKYLEQLAVIEEEMIAYYTQLINKIEDGAIKETCKVIRNDEIRHAQLVKEIQALILQQ